MTTLLLNIIKLMIYEIGQIISETITTSMILSILFKIIIASIILIATYLIGRYISHLLSRFLTRVEEDLRNRIIDISRYLIYAVGILIAIAILSPEPFTFSILILIVGLAVIVSLSDILRNWGSELYIRAVKPFHIGDWIEILGKNGRVVKTDSLGVLIETIDRERVYVPNSVIAREIVVNRTTPYGTIFRLRAEMSSDVDEIYVSEVLAKILGEIRGELVDEPKISYLGVFDGKSVFEIRLVLLNIRKIEDIIEFLNKRIREIWPDARVRI